MKIFHHNLLSFFGSSGQKTIDLRILIEGFEVWEVGPVRKMHRNVDLVFRVLEF